jgi:DNA-binding MarR family transcriptional regulator
MADLNCTSEALPLAAPARHSAARASAAGAATPYELIELFFFAYRDFIGGPDRILAEYGFGRAHHRVLHFVDRNPGLTIAELLDILKITKQSLNRVLKELVDKQFIEVRAGVQDRRQRLLYASDAGRDLARDLARLQGERILDALRQAGPEGEAVMRAYLMGLVDPGERGRVAELIRGGTAPPP